jgi:hypothetical protein
VFRLISVMYRLPMKNVDGLTTKKGLLTDRRRYKCSWKMSSRSCQISLASENYTIETKCVGGLEQSQGHAPLILSPFRNHRTRFETAVLMWIRRGS